MAKTREKKVLLTGKMTAAEAEEHFAKFADADARIQNINSIIDVKMTEIRQKYSEELLELQEIKDDAMEHLQHFAVSNRDDLFSKKKSMELSHGILGFRTGTPKLKTLKGFTWGAVLNVCKSLLPEYIRTTEELAKDKLLADRDNEEIAPKLKDIGVYVDQDETFFVEPKKEAVTA